MEEETQDLDWFGVDDNGEVAHFASGGCGFLPPSVKASRSNLRRLTVYFREYLSANGSGIESSGLPSHVQFTSEAHKAKYLADFSRMAARGIYSFDCVIGPKWPSHYFMVARPSRPLKVDGLPDDIRNILIMTRFSGTFSSADLAEQGDVA